MNYVKILFRPKGMKEIVLPIDKWEKIIESQSQLIKYTLPEETEWTGRTFNKADIVGSEPDKAYKVPDTTEYDIYRNKVNNTILRMKRGTLPQRTDIYEKI